MDDLPRYRLIRTIASGGMAQIYEAKLQGAQGFERRVALKRMLPQYLHDPSMRRMFLDEARVASRLHHGNIVQVIDYGTVDDHEFIVMEFVDGVDASRARAAGTEPGSGIPAGIALHIIAETAHALSYAHELKDERGAPMLIVHRDVSPQNILLSWQGDVKLSDFGIAVAVGREERTQTGVIKGKRFYMAPEQARGQSVGSAADIYALGSTLKALVSPMRGHDTTWASYQPPGPLGELVAACLRDDPEARPPASEVAERAAELASASLERDSRSSLRDWLAPLQAVTQQRSSLDDVFDLALVPLGSRRFTVSRHAAATQLDADATTKYDLPQAPHVQTASRSRLPWFVGLAAAVALAVVAYTQFTRDGAPARSGVATVTPASHAPGAPTAAVGQAVDSESKDAPHDMGTALPDGPRLDRTSPRLAARSIRQRPRLPTKTARRRTQSRTVDASRRRPLPSATRGWLRVGGRRFAGQQIEVDGRAVGYAPLEISLAAGPHLLLVRDAATKQISHRAKILVEAHHARSTPLRIIR